MGQCNTCCYFVADMSLCGMTCKKTYMLATCSKFMSLEDEQTQLSSLTAPVVEKKQIAAPKIKKPSAAYVMHVEPDDNRPYLEPYGHQVEAIERYKNEEDITLFFEMGCGKSLTTLRIAQEKYLAGEIDSMLVIAPNDVHRQWFDELVYGIDKDGDGVMWQELSIPFDAECVGGRGGQKVFYAFDDYDCFKFVSVNVDTFSQPHKWEDIVAWANSRKCFIVIDEATVIKNVNSKRSQRILYQFNDVTYKGRSIASSKKKFPVRAVLTGTPVTNGIMDLWAIMEFIHPNFFGRNYYSFKSYYCMTTTLVVQTAYGSSRNIDVLLNREKWEGIKRSNSFHEAQVLFGCSEDTYMTIKHQDSFQGPFKHAEELKKQLEKVAMFKKLVDCVDMPKCIYMERRVHMSDAQKAVYNDMKKDMMAQFAEHITTAKNKLIINLRLQQISSGFIMGQRTITDGGWDFSLFTDENPAMFERDLMPNEVVWIGDSNPKLEALMRDVEECDKPLLILTRYSAEAAKIYDLCLKAGYKTGLFTGWKVVGGVEAFKNGEIDVLVANSSKISRGFNLQIAHVTLFYSNTFSMEVRQQAEFRTFRIGQKNPCLYIDYSCADVDDTINNALKMKKGLLDYIREKDINDLV